MRGTALSVAAYQSDKYMARARVFPRFLSVAVAGACQAQACTRTATLLVWGANHTLSFPACCLGGLWVFWGKESGLGFTKPLSVFGTSQ